MSESLSAYDLLEMIAFDNKVKWEGSFVYAAENYGPRLESLDYKRLSVAEVRELYDRHWGAVAQWHADRTPQDAGDLHNAHIDGRRKRLDDRCLWAVRFRNGNVSPEESEETARWLANEPSWHVAALLARDEPGGEWREVPA